MSGNGQDLADVDDVRIGELVGLGQLGVERAGAVELVGDIPQAVARNDRIGVAGGSRRRLGLGLGLGLGLRFGLNDRSGLDGDAALRGGIRRTDDALEFGGNIFHHGLIQRHTGIELSGSGSESVIGVAAGSAEVIGNDGVGIIGFNMIKESLDQETESCDASVDAKTMLVPFLSEKLISGISGAAVVSKNQIIKMIE